MGLTYDTVRIRGVTIVGNVHYFVWRTRVMDLNTLKDATGSYFEGYKGGVVGRFTVLKVVIGIPI
jgi:hypothetical protein